MTQMFGIKTDLWPMPGHYMSGLVSPLSLLAFHIQILAAKKGNLINGKPEQYLYRDSSIPLPRAATFDAWRCLLGIGLRESGFYYIPFLPSIRGDEEGGAAGSLKGAGESGSAHLPTLTRRSALHVRDSNGHISWGAIYIGRWDGAGDSLSAQYSRSDIPETFIIPRSRQAIDSDAKTHGSLRTRLEFLAQFGIPATSTSRLPLQSIRRLLFQVLSRESAERFANGMKQAAQDYHSSPMAEQQDYLQMLHDIRESQKKYQQESKKAKEYIPKSRKLNFLDQDLTLND